MKKRDKRFLNDRQDEGGSVSWEVKVQPSNRHSSNDATLYGNLSISDCSDSINLDFECYNFTPYKVQKRIDKLDELLTSLYLMREALTEAKSIAEKQERRKRPY